MKGCRPVMGAEDFGWFSVGGVPTLMYFLGTTAPERYDESRRPVGKPLPGVHTDSYAPRCRSR